ncbi:hypothetical protein QIL89_gp1 [ssRNA phage Esthiorhiza.4_1]|uniref:Uncharacterized protein n=2 Tax=unclassified Fiersviridae TaxID=2852980 RepID=A0A8S5L3C7_9VIRU|nr:hypothetical protein QIL89_gp1 [ssRNA phage Esthiorhiza.4_1]QDH88276.1 MAG: hypothetical protein H4RhizoLitter19220_000007 [Leviviridae sp.]DAD51932.1 TPA_asm: hypothetical protein [ssRNA phage Esthiorhiza.4_1]
MPNTSNGKHLLSQRKLLEAAFVSYLRVAMRKHALPPDLLVVSDPAKLSDVELDAAVTIVKDLAHLPPG